MSRRTMFPPILPKPIMASCMFVSRCVFMSPGPTPETSGNLDWVASRPRHTVEHQKSTAGAGDVGHVERWPVERAAVDAQEVGDRAVVRAVEEVAERAPHDEADADGAAAIHGALAVP